MKLFNRYTLLGAGLGLLLAVVLLAAGGGLSKRASDVEIIARARRLGMSFGADQRVGGGTPLVGAAPPPSAPSSASPDGGISVSPEVQGGPGSGDLVAAKRKPGSRTAPQVRATSATVGQKKATAAQTPAAAKAEPKSQPTIMVTIPRGATLQDVARLMAKAELIGDENEFVRRLQADGASNRIVAGRYKMATDINVHQLIGRILAGPTQNE